MDLRLPLLPLSLCLCTGDLAVFVFRCSVLLGVHSFVFLFQRISRLRSLAITLLHLPLKSAHPWIRPPSSFLFHFFLFVFVGFVVFVFLFLVVQKYLFSTSIISHSSFRLFRVEIFPFGENFLLLRRLLFLLLFVIPQSISRATRYQLLCSSFFPLSFLFSLVLDHDCNHDHNHF